jgi:hypothetical protein
MSLPATKSRPWHESLGCMLVVIVVLAITITLVARWLSP